MKKTGIVFIALWALLSTFQAIAKEASLTDDAIAQRLIDDSIAAYSGNCPCPYNTARNGSRCGKRSAYNRPGGAVRVTPTTAPSPEAMPTNFRSRSISPLKGVPSSDASTTIVTTPSDFARRQQAVNSS